MSSDFSFTRKYSGDIREIDTVVGVSETLCRDKDFIDTKAVWDTGAMKNCISPGLVKKLHLSPFSSVMTRGINGMMKECPVYRAALKLPNGMRMMVDVVGVDIGGKGILIGMDIMSHLDVIISHDEVGDLYFAFRPHNGQKVITFDD